MIFFLQCDSYNFVGCIYMEEINKYFLKLLCIFVLNVLLAYDFCIYIK